MRSEIQKSTGLAGLPPPYAVALTKIEGTVGMKELGKELRCDPSFVTAIADGLEERGLVRREVDPEDRRAKNLVLTSKGATLRDEGATGILRSAAGDQQSRRARAPDVGRTAAEDGRHRGREIQTMKAFAIDEFGGAGSLRDLPVPDPTEGQLRVRVAAAALNPFDAAVVGGALKDRMQHVFPLVPGLDAAGTVDALGEGVEGFEVGDAVFGSVGKMVLGEGTLAEFATVSKGTIARRPASIDEVAAAASPTAGVTALVIAEALELSEGQNVVVVGATGGVGAISSSWPHAAVPGSSRSVGARTRTTLASSAPPRWSTTPRAT